MKTLMEQKLGRKRPTKGFSDADIREFAKHSTTDYPRDNEKFRQFCQEQGTPLASEATIECLDFMSPGVYPARLQNLWEVFQEDSVEGSEDEDDTVQTSLFVEHSGGLSERFVWKDGSVHGQMWKHLSCNTSTNPLIRMIEKNTAVRLDGEEFEIFVNTSTYEKGFKHEDSGTVMDARIFPSDKIPEGDIILRMCGQEGAVDSEDVVTEELPVEPLNIHDIYMERLRQHLGLPPLNKPITK